METMPDLESHLHSSLTPVDPDGKFISHLRTRLLASPDIVIETPSEGEKWASSILLASTIVALSLAFGLLLRKLLITPSKKNPG